jgi:hypothetical protein
MRYTIERWAGDRAHQRMRDIRTGERCDDGAVTIENDDELTAFSEFKKMVPNDFDHFELAPTAGELVAIARMTSAANPAFDTIYFYRDTDTAENDHRELHQETTNS